MSSYLENLSPTDLLTLYEQAFSSVEEVCSQLAPEDWDRPTDLPGWSVKDNLSHLTHYESVAIGRPQPEVDLPEDLPHVRNDIGRLNEAGIEARRGSSGSQVLEEFREVTAERIKALHGLDPASFSETTIVTPFGESSFESFLPIRILDVFFHEQDIRRAVDRPGHLDGEVARFAFERMAGAALPRVFAKQAGAPDGSSVVFEVPAPGRTVAVAVDGGRGAQVDPPADPTVRFTTDFQGFLALFGGRRSPEQLRAEGRLQVEGDQNLAATILAAIAVVP